MKLITVGKMEIEINRKPIKNMYLRVNPKTGKVRLSAPLFVKEDTIIRFAKSKEQWVENRQKACKNREEPSKPKYQTGESVSLWGRAYPLVVIKGANKVEIAEGNIVLTVKDGSTLSTRKRLMEEWYRAQLKEKIAEVSGKWEKKIGVLANEWCVKKMKTRWGSCNIKKKRIWLNLQLAQLPQTHMEYVMAHELVHLLEKNHNRVFYGFMDRFYPDWKECKGELNRYGRRILE